MSERFTRAAIRSDAARIAAIYNQGIEDRVATFETEPRTAEHILNWFAEGYPVFVSGEIKHSSLCRSVPLPVLALL